MCIGAIIPTRFIEAEQLRKIQVKFISFLLYLVKQIDSFRFKLDFSYGA